MKYNVSILQRGGQKAQMAQTEAHNITLLKGIKKTRAQLLAQLGITTIRDLLNWYPRAYEDRSRIQNIADLQPDIEVTVRAVVMRSNHRRIRGNFSITTVQIQDETGRMTLLYYNQAYLKNSLRVGEWYSFYGKVSKGRQGWEMSNPAFARTPVSSENFARIQPIYPLTKGLSQNNLRSWIQQALSYAEQHETSLLTDYLPEDIRQAYQLCSKAEALRGIHLPQNADEAERARRRLVFEELLTLQVQLLLWKEQCDSQKQGIVFPKRKETETLIANLPFTLSGAQRRVWQEIQRDMESPKMMNRLVLGDVGSGKTVLAALAMAKAIACGYQAVLMAPTEILAEQHKKTFDRFFAGTGITTGLLIGSLPPKRKQALQEAIANGEISCIIGTHALIQKKVTYKNVGIVITDEQHRFGVRQRSILAESGTHPDVLVMTATPIPRTLALILYGDLDISLVDEMPQGRLPIQTYLGNEALRPRILNWTRKLIEEGGQAYVIHPLVEENAERDLLSATQNYEHLSQTVFAGIPTALVHGQMPAAEKERVMADFAAGKTKILFSTTVIEVGVDVPNACVILIENAERFGLAQLHQLRGRVGRGRAQSYCVLFTENKSELTRQRMSILKRSNNGFEISEKDLALRGPGEFFGTHQHGLPNFKLANLYEDQEILKEAQAAANGILTRQDAPDVVRFLEEIRKNTPEDVAL